MTPELGVLSLTAASVACLHTLLGPDHYLPFLAMARAGRWTLIKTILVTLGCGLGHVLSSVLLGAAGIALGLGALKLEHVESIRGDVAGWLLLTFGLIYLVWGIRRAARGHPHTHVHVHADGTVHAHKHTHTADHLHIHGAHETGREKEGDAADVRPSDGSQAAVVTPWVLFVIFLFGPCEPLIPLLMYPAAQGRAAGVVTVAIVFTLVTLGTMIGLVALGYRTLERIHAAGGGVLGRLERYGHALAGFVIVLCGAAIQAGL